MREPVRKRPSRYTAPVVLPSMVQVQHPLLTEVSTIQVRRSLLTEVTTYQAEYIAKSFQLINYRETRLVPENVVVTLSL